MSENIGLRQIAFEFEKQFFGLLKIKRLTLNGVDPFEPILEMLDN